MATVSEILQIEDANDGKTITLFGEGGFYRAYNRSAWLACLLMKDFKVTKRHIKIVDRDIAFVGFPKGSLDTWAKGMQVKNGLICQRARACLTVLWVAECR